MTPMTMMTATTIQNCWTDSSRSDHFTATPFVGMNPTLLGLADLIFRDPELTGPHSQRTGLVDVPVGFASVRPRSETGGEVVRPRHLVTVLGAEVAIRN